MMTTILHILALLLYAGVGTWYGLSLATGRSAMPRTGVALIGAAVAAHAAGLIAFSVSYGELPLVGLAASLSTFAFLVGAGLLAAALVSEARPIGLVLAPIIAVVLIAVVALGIAPTGEELEFRGVWFTMHVVLAFVAYAAMAVAFAASLLYLLQFRELKDKRFGRVFRFVPSLETLDRMAARALITGFPALTLALVLGWAWTIRFRHSLSMNDPKVMWAAFTWLAFAIALMSRRGRVDVERRAARVTVTAFAAIVAVYVVLRISLSSRGVFL
jgi:ABC-type transport system involved in cytochrome c biogenesis permease subunit